MERWSRQGDVMTRNVTVEDPVMFTKPWTYGPEKTTLANQATTFSRKCAAPMTRPI